MKALIRQFLGKNHSWSVVGWNTARALQSLGHQVDLYSTDGIQHLPTDLKANLVGYHEENKQMPSQLNTTYQLQFAYTSMKNFPAYLTGGFRIGMWCYEWDGANVLPYGFAKYYQAVDVLATPSRFAKQVFMHSGIPDRAIRIVPHGVNQEFLTGNSTMNLPTTKRFKILVNIAQNHLRKNIPGMLEAYGKAFTNKDDVCLVLKMKDKPLQQQFEISLKDTLRTFNDKFPNHAQVVMLNQFLPDMSALYRSVDAVFSMSHCECFNMVSLEALLSGKLPIMPNHGGQLDHLTVDNSLLIGGEIVRANPRSMYWESKHNALWFQPSVDDAVDKLRWAEQNFESFNAKLASQKPELVRQHSWHRVVSDMVSLCPS